MPINRQDEESKSRWYDPADIADRLKNPEVMECSCGCTHFQQVEVHQYPKMHQVVLGQPVQPHGLLGFYILKCLKCGEVYEPSVHLGARDQARRAYDLFLDEMEGIPAPKLPSKPEVL